VNRNVKSQPPWDFLLGASRASLQSFELSRLNHAANLRKEIVQLLDAWLEETSFAHLARFLLKRQEQLARPAVVACACGLNGDGPLPVSDNLRSDASMPAPRSRTTM
jgi:hypothetical protein